MIKKLAIAFFSICILVGLGVFAVTQPLITNSSPFPVSEVSAEILAEHVRVLSQDCHPRSHAHPANLEKAALYIEQSLIRSGGRVNRQYITAGGERYWNVIAMFGPDEGPVLIVGAHYDSCSMDDEGISITPTPGADDNASGVAALLAVADLLGKQPPAGPVSLVAYTLEEPPYFGTELMGSNVHAASLAATQADVIGMLSLEMLGFYDDSPGSQSYPLNFLRLFYPDTGNFVGVVGRFQDISLTRKVKAAMSNATNLPVRSINAVADIPGIDYSDHRNYWSFGYRAVMLTDTAFYRNTAYHTTADTADSLDYSRMAMAAQAVFVAVHELTR